jgi:thymidylate synthase ThyX
MYSAEEAQSMNQHEIGIIDDVPPENIAMLQALYSRSPESYTKHLEKVRKSGSGKFMSAFYVGYGHKSIADCGTTTVFFENVSLLAAKAIQDWPLYCGQETSTRYIDMSKRDIISPVRSVFALDILHKWMQFYTNNQDRVAQTIRERYPIRDGEAPDTYEKAVKARTFDVMRGFLPAGITTQLSWHTNLRQAGDHLLTLVNHPSPEISVLAKTVQESLHNKYPSSGFLSNTASVSGVGSKDEKAKEERIKWEQELARKYTYQPSFGNPVMQYGSELRFDSNIFFGLEKYQDLLDTRPRGCILPHFLSDLGQVRFSFLLDFGSFRDIQRHRNGVCRMPLLTTEYKFEEWYIEQLDESLQKDARALIENQTTQINGLTDDPVLRQYYTALGFRVQTELTYALPAAIYVMELRSGKAIHPTLRKKIHKMIGAFQFGFPNIPLHVDLDPSDWDVRRGLQTITAK